MQQLQQYADSARLRQMKPNVRKQAVDNAINRVLLEETVKKLDVKVDRRRRRAGGILRENFVSDEAFKSTSPSAA